MIESFHYRECGRETSMRGGMTDCILAAWFPTQNHLSPQTPRCRVFQGTQAREAIFAPPGIRHDTCRLRQHDCGGVITDAAMISPRKQVHMQEFSSKTTCLSNVISALRNALLKRGE
jgi:hypothetical protein